MDRFIPARNDMASAAAHVSFQLDVPDRIRASGIHQLGTNLRCGMSTAFLCKVVTGDRTNNVAEGWNNRLRTLFGHQHPTVWRLSALQADAAEVSACVLKTCRREPATEDDIKSCSSTAETSALVV